MKYRGIEPESGIAVEVTTEMGQIRSVVKTEGAGESLPYICRGFLDMQVNGYDGSDYSREDLDDRQIRHIIRSLAASGTTRHVPTIVTRPRETIARNLREISAARGESAIAAAAIAGIHIEGPYISGEDGPRGAHDLRYVRDPDFDEFLEWQDAAEGMIRIVTLAPERKGALEFIEKISAAGVVASIGHTAASPERIREAVAAGCTLSTHLGNGSHAYLPRLRNYLWEQLAADGLAAGIISDGFHLPGTVVKVISAAKGMDRLVLVSDVAMPGGYRPGFYKWGNLDVQVFADGHIGLAGTTFLAGAGHLLDWDIPRFMEFAGATLAQAIRLCTVNPAALLGLAPESSTLAAGDPADLVLFRMEKGAERLKVEKTVICGEEMTPAGA